MMTTQSPTIEYVKRETACWGKFFRWRGICSMESETVYHRSYRDVILTDTGYVCRDDRDLPVKLTAELTVEEISGENEFRVMIKETLKRLYETALGQTDVWWYESPRFNRLSDAQLWGDWAITRWHHTDRFTAAGAEIRTDLDERGNPYGD